ncbi:MAG: hypothetical protein HKL82_02850 [Acidimicrobiaceae bacterium]|nr:hypothetical protein [Acidimicrobiaceae bacterium]
MLVASGADLLSHKLKVVLLRAESKDYYDIDALLASGIPLDAGLTGARTLFGTAFQPAEALKALTYFGDGDLADIDLATRTRLKTSSESALRKIRSAPD